MLRDRPAAAALVLQFGDQIVEKRAQSPPVVRRVGAQTHPDVRIVRRCLGMVSGISLTTVSGAAIRQL
jgi:hypothetical protein